jgi:hypothetical protein
MFSCGHLFFDRIVDLLLPPQKQKSGGRPSKIQAAKNKPCYDYSIPGAHIISPIANRLSSARRNYCVEVPLRRERGKPDNYQAASEEV